MTWSGMYLKSGLSCDVVRYVPKIRTELGARAAVTTHRFHSSNTYSHIAYRCGVNITYSRIAIPVYHPLLYCNGLSTLSVSLWCVKHIHTSVVRQTDPCRYGVSLPSSIRNTIALPPYPCRCDIPTTPVLLRTVSAWQQYLNVSPCKYPTYLYR